MKKSLCVILLLAGLFACQADRATSTIPVAATPTIFTPVVAAKPVSSTDSQQVIPPIIWELSYFMVDGVVYQPSQKGAQIKFYTSDSVKGHDTCNSYWGSYSIDASSGSMKMYDLMETAVMCYNIKTGEDLSGNILDGHYLTAALSDISGYELGDGNELKLFYNKGASVLVFHPSSSPFPFDDLGE